MKIVTAVLCLLSVGILSGCVDDRGYRSSGVYVSSTTQRSYDRNRYYRNNDRDFRRDRYNRRGDYRRYPPNYRSGTQYGVIIR